ncbi:MAG: metallophosphoesterase family protein, partial [Chloroflexi bacterium]|nr:metallophosphoesterase family protein [Chloroflexota bacterium]
MTLPMRLLAIADIHGNLKQLRRILAHAATADVIVLPGDITHLGSPDEAAAAVSLCRERAPAVVTVTGNCDDELIEKQMVKDGN